MLICPQCDTRNPVNNKFCQGCGFSLNQVICQGCQIPVAISEPTCSECSNSLERLLLALTQTEGLESEAVVNERYRVKEVLSPERCLLVDTKPNHEASV